MEVPDASNSECEFVSENNVVSNNKRKRPSNKKNTQNAKPMKPEVSEWWDHFQETKIPNFAECIYCQDLVPYATKSTINHLIKHMHACKEYPPNVDLRQELHHLESKTHLSDEASVETVTIPRLRDPNQEALEKALAKMVIVDKLPLSFIEGEGFVRYCKTVNPFFVIPSRAKLRAMILDGATDDETPRND